MIYIHCLQIWNLFIQALKTGWRANLWHAFLTCFASSANKFYIYWQCMYFLIATLHLSGIRKAISWSVTIYSKTLSSQCKLTTRIEPMQAKMCYGCFVPAIRNGRLFYALKSRNMASAFVTLSVKLQIVVVFKVLMFFKFSPGTPVSSTNNTDSHDITEILLKVALTPSP